ncbi:UDP-N-acetylmuramoyl-L-alanyl-D-glutamate--2,6-diaminopimelate ligase [soil metagenome]
MTCVSDSFHPSLRARRPPPGRSELPAIVPVPPGAARRELRIISTGMRPQNNTLSDMTALLQQRGQLVATAHERADITFNSVTVDSRSVTSGVVFIAIRGLAADGHRFIGEAIEKGAVAIVGEIPPDSLNLEAEIQVPYVQVADGRISAAIIAAGINDYPATKLKMVGITGTNGKTTTSHLLYHLLRAAGETPGLIGTVGIMIGDEEMVATHTTPDSIALQEMLAQMSERGCSTVAMEVSSHALEQHRADEIEFASAVFTNLSHDHLDYHGTPEAYARAKARLFEPLSSKAFALVNGDDPVHRVITADTAAAVVRFGLADDADIRFEVVSNASTGLVMRIHEQADTFGDGEGGVSDERAYRLIGRFNAYNLAAAYAAARSIGISPEAALSALAEAPAVPGRFESFSFEDQAVAVVDYAHTPDALENVLLTARELLQPGARLHVVFGAGGDRDREKRALMGAVADRHADAIILTSDNPRSEEPGAILADIRGGISGVRGDLFVIPDRALAIERAAALAEPQDIVVVAGKGHETYQITGTETQHFDDREEVLRAFSVEHGPLTPSSAVRH